MTEDKTITSTIERDKELDFPSVAICPKHRKPFKSSWGLGTEIEAMLMGETPTEEFNLTIHSKAKWQEIWDELNHSVEEILETVQFYNRVNTPTMIFDSKEQVFYQ